MRRASLVPTPEDQGGHHRDDGERDRQGGEQRERDGERHDRGTAGPPCPRGRPRAGRRRPSSRVDAITARPTSEAALATPTFDATESPASRCLKIASRTTMALSTSMPTPRASPPSEMMFRLVPVRYIRKKVATIEIGIDTPMIRVLRRILEEQQQDHEWRWRHRSGRCCSTSSNRRLDEARPGSDAGDDLRPLPGSLCRRLARRELQRLARPETVFASPSL